MGEVLANYYLWIKAAHIISVIAWMAAMLYLPRLFVYHAGVAHGSPEATMLEVMEYRLLRFIMTPAMILTWCFGLLLLSIPGIVEWKTDYWMHSKITLVILLTGLHGLLSIYRKRFIQGKNTRTARYYRFINEVPTIFMILVVFLVVVKP